MLELFFSRGVVFVMFVSTIVENQNSVGGFSCPSHNYVAFFLYPLIYQNFTHWFFSLRMCHVCI